jgi:hypothetical protein
MEPATEGMTWLQIAGVIVAIVGLGAGSAWLSLWFTQRGLDRHDPGEPEDQKKPPR